MAISGETGSGKSTQVPQYLLDDLVKNNQPGQIYVTQPRRIAATTVSEHVSKMRPKWGRVGQGLVGYQVGLERCLSRDSRIVYMTPAIVTNRMQSDRHLTGVRYLIIDEVHERDMETEMLLLLVKNLLKQSETIKVIIMSATIDLDVYRPYFHTFQPQTISAQGRCFDVEVLYKEQIDKEIYR